MLLTRTQCKVIGAFKDETVLKAWTNRLNDRQVEMKAASDHLHVWIFYKNDWHRSLLKHVTVGYQISWKKSSWYSIWFWTNKMLGDKCQIAPSMLFSTFCSIWLFSLVKKSTKLPSECYFANPFFFSFLFFFFMFLKYY